MNQEIIHTFCLIDHQVTVKQNQLRHNCKRTNNCKSHYFQDMSLLGTGAFSNLVSTDVTLTLHVTVDSVLNSTVYFICGLLLESLYCQD